MGFDHHGLESVNSKRESLELRTRNPNHVSLMLVVVIMSLGLMWIVFSTYAVPPLIKSAYRGESLPIFNKMISGQASHPVAGYLSYWDRLRWRVLLDFSLVGLLVVLVTRPEFRRPLWEPAAPHHTVPVLAEQNAVSSIPPPARLQRVFVVFTVLVLVGVGAARIVSTYRVFSQTFDEPAAVAAGMEWLDQGTYTVENSHPPLARVAVALGPFLDGLHMPADAGSWVTGRATPVCLWCSVGNQILYARDQYSHNLALARLGVLPFFFLATAVVWVWSRKAFGDASALLATLLFTTLPPVLAHAGLATTDMALAATVMAALLAFICCLECPTYLRSCVLGLTAALAILSKFSALLFLPGCGLAILACLWRATRRRTESPKVPWRRRAIAIALTMSTTFLVIWGGYRFSVQSYNPQGRPHENIDGFVGAEGTLHRLAYLVAEHAPIPAPELLEGINFQRLHNEEGGLAYLLGDVRQTGWWYFFPVVLAVKSPLPFLVLSGIGLVLLGRQGWRGADWRAVAPAATAMTLLLVSLASRIDFGVRLILPIYPLLAIVAGFGAVRLWNLARPKRVGPAMVVVLLLWQLTSSARIHPDYLAYFNELAGRHPDRVRTGSDLDWGQDLLRLANALHARKIDSVMLGYYGTADLSRHNLPQWKELQPYQPATGWIAISEHKLKLGERRPPYRGYAWLEAYEPRAVVGKSIRLYYIPEGTRVPGKEGPSR